MGLNKHNKSVLVHLLIIFLCTSSVSVTARVAQPLLQNYGKSFFRSNIHSIYDTSNYAFFSLVMVWLSLLRWDGTAGTYLHAISMKQLLRKQLMHWYQQGWPSWVRQYRLTWSPRKESSSCWNRWL